MQWIYLSPHFDDIALSFGGPVWEQVQAGTPTEVWTICGGDAPSGPLTPFAQSLHARWGADEQAVELRRLEDIASCRRMGASYRHFPIPDCIYRRAGGSLDKLAFCQGPGEALVQANEDLQGPLLPKDETLVADLSKLLDLVLPPQARLVCPLGIGNHLDHQLVRAAAERGGRSLLYYADYPYVLHHPEATGRLLAAGWRQAIFPLSKSGLEAWYDAVAEHASQISTFWPSQDEMRLAIREFASKGGGPALYAPPA